MNAGRDRRIVLAARPVGLPTPSDFRLQAPIPESGPGEMQLGYGERGAGGVIPPGATLVFEVELFRILPG